MQELPWEDALLERKVESDLKDLLKTLVAFANSVRPGHTAVLLIGERDDGSAQGLKDADSIQKTVRTECDKIYPPILWRSRVYEKDGRPCVRVEIEFSGETPHFSGAAWVRRGSESLKANDETFQRLIDFRLSTVRELAKWLDKEIIVAGDQGTVSFQERNLVGHPRWPGSRRAKLRFVNRFWATFEDRDKTVSEPLEKLILSWEDTGKCLVVLVKI